MKITSIFTIFLSQKERTLLGKDNINPCVVSSDLWPDWYSLKVTVQNVVYHQHKYDVACILCGSVTDSYAENIQKVKIQAPG